MADDADPGAARDDGDTREAIREGLAEVRRQVAELAAAQAQLVVAAHRRDLRRWAVDAAGPMAVVLALLTAFGLANAAAVHGLASVMPSWAAALVLAGLWVVVGAALASGIWVRGEHGEGLRWWRALGATSEGALDEVRAARERAEQGLRESLERLAPDVATEAASMAVPIASAVASGMTTQMVTDVAADVVDAGTDLLDGADEMVESITQEVPGGGIVNQIWSVALLPGRAGIRVVTTVLRGPGSGRGKPPDGAS
jgi:hypothetical protein